MNQFTRAPVTMSTVILRLKQTNTIRDICWAEAFLPTIWTDLDTPSSLGSDRDVLP